MPSRSLTLEDLDGLRVVDLKEALKERDLATDGKKAVLLERLREAFQLPPQEAGAKSDDGDSTDSDPKADAEAAAAAATAAAEATAESTAEETAEATVEDTAEPAAEATVEATAESTAEESAGATVEDTAEPTAEPTAEATAAFVDPEENIQQQEGEEEEQQGKPEVKEDTQEAQEKGADSGNAEATAAAAAAAVAAAAVAVEGQAGGDNNSGVGDGGVGETQAQAALASPAKDVAEPTPPDYSLTVVAAAAAEGRAVEEEAVAVGGGEPLPTSSLEAVGVAAPEQTVPAADMVGNGVDAVGTGDAMDVPGVDAAAAFAAAAAGAEENGDGDIGIVVAKTPDGGGDGGDGGGGGGGGGGGRDPMDVEGEEKQVADESNNLAAFLSSMGGGDAAAAASPAAVPEAVVEGERPTPPANVVAADAASDAAAAVATAPAAVAEAAAEASVAAPKVIPFAAFTPVAISAPTARAPPASSSEDTYAYEEEQERLTMLKNLHQPMRKWFNEDGSMRERFGNFPLFWQDLASWPPMKELKKMYLIAIERRENAESAAASDALPAQEAAAAAATASSDPAVAAAAAATADGAEASANGAGAGAAGATATNGAGAGAVNGAGGAVAADAAETAPAGSDAAAGVAAGEGGEENKKKRKKRWGDARKNRFASKDDDAEVAPPANKRKSRWSSDGQAEAVPGPAGARVIPGMPVNLSQEQIQETLVLQMRLQQADDEAEPSKARDKPRGAGGGRVGRAGFGPAAAGAPVPSPSPTVAAVVQVEGETGALSGGRACGWHQELVRWMVMTGQPLSTVESVWFKNMVRAIRGTASVPTREVVVDTMRKAKADVHAKTTALLAGEHACVAANSRTSVRGGNYTQTTSLSIALVTKAWMLVTLPVDCIESGGAGTVTPEGASSESGGLATAELALAARVKAVVEKLRLEGRVTAVVAAAADCCQASPGGVEMGGARVEDELCGGGALVSCCSSRLGRTAAVLLDAPRVKRALCRARELSLRYARSSEAEGKAAERLARPVAALGVATAAAVASAKTETSATSKSKPKSEAKVNAKANAAAKGECLAWVWLGEAPSCGSDVTAQDEAVAIARVAAMEAKATPAAVHLGGAPAVTLGTDAIAVTAAGAAPSGGHELALDAAAEEVAASAAIAVNAALPSDEKGVDVGMTGDANTLAVSAAAVASEWLSTYGMVAGVLALKSAIAEHEEGAGAEEEERWVAMLSGEDWAVLYLVDTVLEPFVAAQKRLDGARYVTGSMVVPIIFDLRARLKVVVDGLRASVGDAGDGDDDCLFSAAAKAAVLPAVLALQENFYDCWGGGVDVPNSAGSNARGEKDVVNLGKGNGGSGEDVPNSVSSSGKPQPRVGGFGLLRVLATALDPRTKNLYGIEDEEKPKVWKLVLEETLKIALKMPKQRSSARASKVGFSPEASAPAAGASASGPPARKRPRFGGGEATAATTPSAPPSARLAAGGGGGAVGRAESSRVSGDHVAKSVQQELEAFKAAEGLEMFTGAGAWCRGGGGGGSDGGGEEDSNSFPGVGGGSVSRGGGGGGLRGGEGDSKVYLNPLEWWGLRSAEFPNLASLARRVLAVPATLIASEKEEEKDSVSRDGGITRVDDDSAFKGPSSSSAAALSREEVELPILLRRWWERIEDWEAPNVVSGAGRAKG